MTEDLVHLDRDDGVWTVTLDDPERRNAYSLAMKDGLLDALATIERGIGDVRCVVLQGAGDAFCAGGDIDPMEESLEDSGSTVDRMRAGYMFTFLRGGPSRQVLTSIGIEPSVNNIRGMILMGTIWLTPYAYTFISAGLQNIDPELEYAAEITGASKWKALFSISLPLLKPFILSSMFLTFLLAFEAISIPAILGLPDGVYVLSTYLYAQEGATVPPPYGKMAVVGLFMIAVSALGALIIQFMIGDVRQYTTITGTSQERTIDTSIAGQVAGVSVLLLYLSVFLLIPLFMILKVGIDREFTDVTHAGDRLLGMAEGDHRA